MKRSPDLPNIEDATLRACLAPLLDAMLASADTALPEASPGPLPGAPPGYFPPDLDVPAGPANSNDLPAAEPQPRGEDVSAPLTRAEWRAAADDDFGVFRTIDLFLGLSEAELDVAAREFPRQIGGTLAQIASIRRRLLARYDTATTATALLERALARAAAADARADGTMRSP